MTKADCTELDQLIYDWARFIAADTKSDTIEKIVAEMKKDDPRMTVEMVDDAILSVQEQKREGASEVQKILAKVMREPSLRKETRKKIKELEDFLENGVIPKKKKKAKEESPLDTLRKTKNNLTKWLENSDPVASET